jgi:2,6-dihydroxypseudooxynicotine hydrolase
MADVDVQAAVDRWRPRLLARGVADSDVRYVAGHATCWAGWHDTWVHNGDEYLAIARDAERTGRGRTAGEAYLRAALSYHFGKFLWLEDVAAYRATTERAVDAVRRGMPQLDPTFERIEIPFGAGHVVANLRRPATAGRFPFVVLVPGMDSTKEEFPRWESVFLRRGIATVSFDGPGQGEAGAVNPLRPDYEEPVAALLDALAARPELDHRGVGITGIGVGGYFAARAAAFEQRITAVASVGGAYRYDRMPGLVRDKFRFSARLDGEEAAAFADRFTLDDVAARITQPFLVLYGEGDRVMTPAQARQPARAAARGEFVTFPRGGTACQSVLHRLNPFLADWMAERLAPAREGSP